MTKTIVTGSLTYARPDGANEFRIKFPAFEATTDTPYVELIDRAEALVENDPRLAASEWCQIDERIIESEVKTDRIDVSVLHPSDEREVGS